MPATLCRPMARGARDPHLLAVFFGALLAGVGGVIAIAETDNWLVLGIVVVAMILLLAGIVVDVTTIDEGTGFGPPLNSTRQAPLAAHPERPGFDYRGPEAPHRVLVMTSEPVPAEQVLEAVKRATEPPVDPATLGVMVVSPEGFGRPEITNDEGHYAAARRAEGETVASLRRASVKAAGHVGDHDAAQAIADALVLFPAERVLVFASPAYAAEYRHAVEPADVQLPVDIADVPAR
jgi:hypothetical protein